MRWNGSRSMAMLKARPWKRAAAAHADAERGDLGAVDVDAGRAVAARGVDVPVGQGVDHRLLDPAHVLAHADLQPPQVEQRIGHDLAGAVVGHLAAAVDVDHRDVARHQHVLGLAGLAEGEHRIVLDQPQLVGRVVVARIGEAPASRARPARRAGGRGRARAQARSGAPRLRAGAAARSQRPLHFRMFAQRLRARASYCSRALGAEADAHRDVACRWRSASSSPFRAAPRCPASSSSVGSSVSRSLSAAPMAESSKVPGNWKPCSGLSDLISIGRIMGPRPGEPNPGSTRLRLIISRAFAARSP